MENRVPDSSEMPEPIEIRKLDRIETTGMPCKADGG